MEKDRIYQGDCLELMKKIEDKSIDMILCDLPYDVLNKGNKNAKWDKALSLDKLWEQYKRVIKDHGAIVLFGQGMFTAQVMMSNPKMWRYNLIWSKDRITGFLNAKRMPLRSHEDIMVFYKKLPTYNPQMFKGAPNHSKGKGVHKFTNSCYGKFNEAKDPDVITDDNYPRSVLFFKKEHDSVMYHPTQKPVELLRYLIRTYTNEGETVLDNTSGGGSTAVAAYLEKRHFICMELNEDYHRVSVERLKKVMESKPETKGEKIEERIKHISYDEDSFINEMRYTNFEDGMTNNIIKRAWQKCYRDKKATLLWLKGLFERLDVSYKEKILRTVAAVAPKGYNEICEPMVDEGMTWFDSDVQDAAIMLAEELRTKPCIDALTNHPYTSDWIREYGEKVRDELIEENLGK